MNELETIIHEVHDHLINNVELSNEINVKVKSYDNVVITYWNLTIVLRRENFCIEYTKYKTRTENYVTQKDLHFEQSIIGDAVCSLRTVEQMIQIRSWYGLRTNLSEEFLTYFNETE